MTLNKQWNWRSCTKLALNASWTHGLIAHLVRASERNSVVVDSSFTQANFLYSYFKESFSGELGFILCKAEQPLQGMELQKKRCKRIKACRKSLLKEPTVNGCLLILDLKPSRLYVKGKHLIGREFQSVAVWGKKLWT